VGFDLLRSVARAVERLQTHSRVVLQAFTGPFMAAEQTAALARRAGPTLRFERFSNAFGAWLQAADASVSMAGYNTCMNILVTRAKALVYPFDQNREQGMRARRLAALGAVGVLDPADLAPERMAERLATTFDRPPAPHTIKLDGAAQTAAWLVRLVAGDGAR
jgi:predicted glycosyltransferase